MKRIYWAVAMVFSMSMFGCSSQPAKNALEETVKIEGKLIQITDIDKGGDQRPLHSKDLQKGIFVRVFNHTLWNGNYPAADAIMRERFTANGFKIVDKVEEADIGITFAVNGQIDLVAANNAAEHSNALTTGQTMGKVAAVAAGLALSPAAAVGSLVGAFIPMDDKSSLQGFISEKPKSNGGNVVMSSIKGSDFINTGIFKYRLEKENKAPDDIILKMMADQWIKLYMIQDTTPATVGSSVAASAVAVKETDK